jgi:hypothetical protein
MASFDVNIRTNIITFLAPQERIDSIIAFDHCPTEEYYQGILKVDDLTRPETYRLAEEDPETLLALAMKNLPLDTVKEIVNMFISGPLKDLLTQRMVDMILMRPISHNLVDKIPAVLVLSSPVIWSELSSAYRFNYINSLKFTRRLTDECLTAIANNGTHGFVRNVHAMITPSPILAAKLV